MAPQPQTPLSRLPSSTSSWTKPRIMKSTISLLLSLNFLFLLTYFLHHPSSSSLPHQQKVTPKLTLKVTPKPPHTGSHFLSSKPWPILPSYLPWSPPDTSLPPRVSSCESYFGNGFSLLADVIPRGPGPTSWFRCHYSGTLRSSVCEGGRVRMDPARIRMSRGGEPIDDVIGRLDDEELPVFDPGAFRVFEEGKGRRRLVTEEFLERYVPEGEIMRHTMRELIGSIEVVGDGGDGDEFECSEWIEEPTVLLTRFEYANVFHTYTDWYSTYVSSRVTGLPVRPNVVFIDGHCKTQLEETWEALFSSIRFAKNFTGPVCFRHAVFAPLGYETAWFKGLSEPIDCHGTTAQDLWANPDDHKTARLHEFGEMIKAAFGFPVEHKIPKPSSEHNVLFVRREDYLAHPRHGGKVESRLSNEEEVFNALKGWASNHSECKVNLINGLFAHMPMREQVRAIEDASVIIGAHGAGLTHIVSASPNTVILEIISAQYRRPHFQLMSQWKGLDYRAINLPASYADTTEVIRQLTRIMKSIGC